MAVGAFAAPPHPRARDLPVHRPEIPGHPQRDRPRAALCRVEHQVHPHGLPARQHRGAGLPRRGEPDPRGPAPQRPHDQERAPLERRAAAADLRAAPGDPDLLQVHRRGQRPLHGQRRVPPGHDLAPRDALPLAAVQNLGERAPDLHPRLRHRRGPRQPRHPRGAPRVLHQGHPAGVVGEPQGHPAGDLLRGDLERLCLRAHEGPRIRLPRGRQERLFPLRRKGRRAPVLLPEAALCRPVRLRDHAPGQRDHRREPDHVLPAGQGARRQDRPLRPPRR